MLGWNAEDPRHADGAGSAGAGRERVGFLGGEGVENNNGLLFGDASHSQKSHMYTANRDRMLGANTSLEQGLPLSTPTSL